MIFEQLPTGVLAVVLGVSCAVKHTALSRLANTAWYRKMMQERHWLGLILLAGGSGVMTYLIFHQFASDLLSVAITVIDTILLAASATYARSAKVFVRKPEEVAVVVWSLRTMLALAHIVFIWLALGTK